MQFSVSNRKCQTKEIQKTSLWLSFTLQLAFLRHLESDLSKTDENQDLIMQVIIS